MNFRSDWRTKHPLKLLSHGPTTSRKNGSSQWQCRLLWDNLTPQCQILVKRRSTLLIFCLDIGITPGVAHTPSVSSWIFLETRGRIEFWWKNIRHVNKQEWRWGDNYIIMKTIPRTPEAFQIAILFNNLECSRKSCSFNSVGEGKRRNKELS